MNFIKITYVIKCTYLGDDEIDRIINADQIVFIDERRRLIHLNDNIELNLTEDSFNELMHFINVRGEGESKIVNDPEKDKFYNDMPDKYRVAGESLVNGTPLTEDSDTISRSVAIKAFNDNLDENYSGGFFLEEMFTHEEAIDIINSLPPVTSTRPKAKWIKKYGGSLIDYYKCSNCGESPCQEWREKLKTWGWNFTKYCPNCGAEMESE